MKTRLRVAGGRAKRAVLASRRSRHYSGRPQSRLWWHRNPHHDYVPALYRSLSRQEWRVLNQWYYATETAGAIGEINVPAMSVLQGFIMGSGIRRTVELGHFYGYSTLLTGFMLRSMGNGGRMVAIDVDADASAFVQKWVDKAKLNDHVDLLVSDSSAPQALEFAVEKLGGMPELILLDSSHQRDHTLAELDLWVPRMDPGTIMFLHDTSTEARGFDETGSGGVQQALDEWLPKHPEVEFININRGVQPIERRHLVYKDGCGIGILQKRLD